MMKSKQGKGGDARKINRDLMKCASYRSSHTRERNKVRKLKKYIQQNPNNLVAVRRLKELENE